MSFLDTKCYRVELFREISQSERKLTKTLTNIKMKRKQTINLKFNSPIPLYGSGFHYATICQQFYCIDVFLSTFSVAMYSLQSLYQALSIESKVTF